MTPDLRGIERTLERQLAVLAPVAGRLHVDAMRPLVAPHDWSGPASAAYRDLEVRLRDRIRRAAEAAGTAVHSTRRCLTIVQDLAAQEVFGA